MKRLTLLITFLFTTFFLVNSVFAVIINIPNDYGTIQQGINSSAVGDTVLVQPGTYVENINFNGKNITLASLYLTTQDTAYISETIIDGDSSGSVVTFENGEDSTAVLSGFTLTNGYNEDGGGIYCHESSPTIRNMLIANNSALSLGGGILIYQCTPGLTLENLLVEGNTSEGSGGGIYCTESENIKFSNIELINNTTFWFGGGIMVDYSNGVLEDFLIKNNSASHPDMPNYGGGMALYYSESIVKRVKIIQNNSDKGGGVWLFNNHNLVFQEALIANNSANKGGGIMCETFTTQTLVNCTITDNVADQGGGVYCYFFSNTTLKNCVLWNDSPEEVYFKQDSYEDTLTISYTDIQGGEEGVVTNNSGTVNWLEGNLDADPLFLDPTDGNYRLTYYSPCIDAGDPNSPLDPDGTITDMGAYYYNQSETIWPGDTNYDGYVDEADIDAIAIYWREQGTPRDTVSFAWQSFSRPMDWEDQIASMADCNGDGEVNITDVLAICLNWHYTHENSDSQIILPENITDYRENFIEVYNSLGNSQVEIKMKNHIAVIFDLPLISNVESRLYQNSPNPFRNETRINFSLKPAVVKAQIEIFNIKGQLVREIIIDADNSQANSVTWDGKDDAGNSVSSGVYFYRLKQDKRIIEIKKALKIR